MEQRRFYTAFVCRIGPQRPEWCFDILPIPIRGHQILALRIEYCAPILGRVGVKLVIIAFRVLDICAVRNQMIGAELDFQSVRRAGLQFIDQDRFAMNFPRKVIETRYLAPETRRLNVIATSSPHRTAPPLHCMSATSWWVLPLETKTASMPGSCRTSSIPATFV